ncbi:HEAT repeat domain-containing protein [Myxococcus sp. K38C18041901]|uniref:HEAT repeat domain-containing protein n=1 Tax=Myxococcus guangdongensis TaxID=2906760 RepID=UPI0020A835F4|nr:HEAT repeat domain-containing protein [Myxococcus guangdongensis]MCP3065054.1 HEAT repeat domain-containing protein [Myxococcus guangdongensis]
MARKQRPRLPPEQRDAALEDILSSERERIIPAANLLSSDPSTLPRLLELLALERRADNRQAILHALSWHGEPDALWELMIRVLSDPTEGEKVRGQASEGLAYMFAEVEVGSTRFEAGVQALLAALKDSAPEVRYCALFALGATAHPPLIPAMEAMLADDTPVPGWVGTVATSAAEALERLRGGYAYLHREKPQEDGSS